MVGGESRSMKHVGPFVEDGDDDTAMPNIAGFGISPHLYLMLHYAFIEDLTSPRPWTPLYTFL